MLPLYQELIQHGGLKIWIYRQVNGIMGEKRTQHNVMHQWDQLYFTKMNLLSLNKKIEFISFILNNVGSTSKLGYCFLLKFSGDVDGVVSTLATRMWIKALNLPVETPWYAWNFQNQVRKIMIYILSGLSLMYFSFFYFHSFFFFLVPIFMVQLAASFHQQQLFLFPNNVKPFSLYFL